ncbi:MAG: leucyl aminopeptidase [Candidatus Micrarchaeota archaeon]|nr:leucyl aminopeptidase [Candidatus Micrarchaeota archaeon]
MQVELTNKPNSEIIAVAMFQGEEQKNAKTYNLDINTFKAKPGVCQTVLLSKNSKVIFAGLGKKEDYNSELLKKAVAKITAVAAVFKAKEITIDATCVESNSVSSIIEGVVLGQYAFLKYKTNGDKTERVEIEKLNIVLNANKKELETQAKTALVIANAVNYCRDLANEPANVATPNFLAQTATTLAGKNIVVTVLDKQELQKLECNSLLSVSQGSIQPPVMVVMEYKPAKYNKTISLVGKGITFDSGGISLKPGKDMDQMKFDKSGACAVIGSVKAIAELQLPIRVVGVFAATENLPSGSASKPGDVVKAYNGKTIEILNTDAEGRLILADALSYTEKNYKPDCIVDIATLTGACVVALGNGVSGLMSNNAELTQKVIQAGEESGDRCWELPLWPEHDEKVKSDIADVKNLGSPEGSGGAISGAAFLKAFVDKTPWVHLDVAGTAWTTSQRDYYSKGATGVGVRLFVKLCQNLAMEK